METIANFSGDYDFLSNFYECTVVYEGIAYKSSEAAFQAAKTTDVELKKQIALMTPSKAKRFCGPRGSLVLREDWDTIKDTVMLNVLLQKFSQNKDLADKLIATGNATLIEGNTWHDNYWGNCGCAKCVSKDGKNKLGQYLTLVRNTLVST